MAKKGNGNRRTGNEKNGERKPHFLIPDGEVDNIEFTPTSRNELLDIDHVSHGEHLHKEISTVTNRHHQKKTPISDEIVIFKIELNENDKADARGDYENIFSQNNLAINAISKSNVAIVSSSLETLYQLEEKVKKYISTKGHSANFFQNIKSISYFEGKEKQDKNLSKIKEDIIDAQITLVPKLSDQTYEVMLAYLDQEFAKINGYSIKEDLYYLSDRTPVLRSMIPSSGLSAIADQEIVLKVEPARFFRPAAPKRIVVKKAVDIPVSFAGDPRDLPTICILDDGIKFPLNLKDCIAGHWAAQEIDSNTCDHGTRVASRAIFGEDLLQQSKNNLFVPRVRVIDAVITDGRTRIYEGVLIKRIQKAVMDIANYSNIFLLAYNDDKNTINDDVISNLSYEIDCLHRKYKIQFVLPVGNHKLWQVYQNFEELIDDDLARLAPPAESFYGLSVGSIISEENSLSLSGEYKLSPFSRIGFGFCGNQKPELVCNGGDVYVKEDKAYISAKAAAYVIDNVGNIIQDYGTSFSAPLAATELALLSATLPDNDPFLAKALLIHHGDEIESSLNNEDYSRLYGFGKANADNANGSYKNRVTFIRRGEMSRLVKQRVQFYIPTNLAQIGKRKMDVAKVSVTCVCLSPIDKNRGNEYLRAYIDTSLHCINSNNKYDIRNPSGREGRKEWTHIHHFSEIFTVFNPGDWQIWLRLFTKPEIMDNEKVEYALVITIENLTSSDIDIHEGISVEAGQRFPVLAEVEMGSEGQI